MPTLIKPNQPKRDFWDITEHEESGARVRVSGSFSISDAKKLNQYINGLLIVHKRMKSQEEPEWKRTRRMCS